ncbi:hypothetical protein [Streptococcus sp. 20-1249]|uniref:hypothetical protein n=1 Tax=Streptococcus hepaticus TaxID=3349163 RepID=UPI003748B1EC
MQQNRDRYFKLADELLALTKDMNIPEDIREKVTKATISKKLAGLSDGLEAVGKNDSKEHDRQLTVLGLSEGISVATETIDKQERGRQLAILGQFGAGILDAADKIDKSERKCQLGILSLSDGLREAAKEDKSEYDRQLKQKKMHKNLPIELLQQSVKSKFRSQNNQQLQPRPHKLSQ